jgi:hypothetical protein
MVSTQRAMADSQAAVHVLTAEPTRYNQLKGLLDEFLQFQLNTMMAVAGHIQGL